MAIIGRGHTVYLDNKTMEYNGTTYEAFHKVKVYVDGENIAKLSEKDRGMTDVMGQKVTMTLEITPNKGDTPQTLQVGLPLPYGMDGVVINLPALLNGAPQEAYQTEFVSLATESDDTEEAPDAAGMDSFEMPAEQEESTATE